ncbi:ATP-binding protein [Chryseolinea sp. T2]|uniref:ATP-binding protein n=1 Tax=Chryseolinea sp. T2 TaxID=3129255 RepID=UPI003077A3A4
MHITKAFIVLIIPLLGWTLSVGQPVGADSLERSLRATKGKPRVDLLNKLTYTYITNDSAKVSSYNKEALTLSHAIGYTQGEARAYTYRGVAEYLSGQLETGHSNLRRGLALAMASGDKELAAYTYLQLGNCSLEEVQMDSAMLFFKSSRAILKDGADPVTLSKLYRNISALYGQRYQTDSQQFYLDRAIAIRRTLPNKNLLVEALAMKADLNLVLGNIPAAEKLTEEATEIIRDPSTDQEFKNDVRRLHALLLFRKGDFDKASVLFGSARNYFLQKSLIRKYVTLLIDVSRVFTERGDYEIALDNLYNGLKVSQLHDFDAESTIIRIQIGWINHFLGDPEHAVLMADEAMQSNPQKLLKGDVADGLTLKGVALIDLKKFNASYICLDSVLHIYKRFGSQQGVSETHMHLGYLNLQRNAYTRAIADYTESIQLAERIPSDQVLAWAYWGRGQAKVLNKDLNNALPDLERSEQYARRFGAKEVIVRNYNTRRNLLSAQGRFKEALSFSILAEQLDDSLRKTDIARRFINLEKIQEIEQRNRDIQSLQQEQLLSNNKIQLQDEKLKKQSIMIIAGLIGLLLLAALSFAYYRFYERTRLFNVSITEKNARIQAQADKLQEVNGELSRLYSEVSEQKQEIQTQAEKLSDSHQSISEMNRGLEQIVAEKTVELRRINEELIKNNNELLQFSFTVSHNLRGPVARLLGLSDLVSRQELPAETRQLVDFIDVTAEELDHIIKDLVDILELRNDPKFSREHIVLEEEWTQIVGRLKDNLTGVEELSSDFKKLPELYTVRSLLGNILYNLLSNSIKFRSPERALKVQVSSHVENGRAVLEVRDNGLGFNIKQHRDKVFKLYRRFHSHVGGRGMGLYLIKTQAEVLHGSVEASSEPDKGALFRIILPLNGEEHA